MKTIALIIVLAFSFKAKASDEKYIEIMSKNIEAIYTAQTVDEIQKAVNTFDRIANAEKAKWEPLYYSAFGNVILATKENNGNKKDNYLDLALSSIEKAKTLKPNDSEIITMEGFIYTIRVTVDPATRGQEFSGKAYTTYNKALQINPENPRALSLLAQLQFGTASFFGTSTTEACATNARAIEKFASQKPESPIAPAWGKAVAEEFQKKCK